MSQKPDMTFSHIGVCVTDLERSTRFYMEALGFVLSHSVEGRPPFDTLAELPGLKLSASFFKRDGVMIELLYYHAPAAVGSTERRPMNQLGLTHLSFVVDDLAAVTDRIAKYGGTVLHPTRISSIIGDMIFCTDPDGVRIELWQKSDAAPR